MVTIIEHLQKVREFGRKIDEALIELYSTDFMIQVMPVRLQG